MNEVSTRKMSSDRQIGNQGKLGFVPTNKSIVEMELNLIDFSEVANNQYSVNICDLSGGTGDQLHWTHEYLRSMNICSNSYYNELSTERYSECVRRYDYIHALNGDFFNIKVGTKNNKALNKKVFSIIRNNPPYMYLEKRGISVRAEIEFFIRNSMLDIAGGIQIMEVPLHQLRGIKNFLNIITYRYEIFVAKFPRLEFEKYKQVVVICKKKANFSQDKETVDKLIELIDNDQLPFLDEVDYKVMKVTKEQFKKASEIDIFRENKVTEKTLKNGLRDCLSSLIVADKKSNMQIIGSTKLKPIIELQPGHISQLLASGKFDNVMGDLLIRGGANKVIEISQTKEDDKTVTTSTEVIKPFIELTNKNGDILFREF